MVLRPLRCSIAKMHRAIPSWLVTAEEILMSLVNATVRIKNCNNTLLYPNYDAFRQEKQEQATWLLKTLVYRNTFLTLLRTLKHRKGEITLLSLTLYNTQKGFCLMCVNAIARGVCSKYCLFHSCFVSFSFAKWTPQGCYYQNVNMVDIGQRVYSTPYWGDPIEMDPWV